MGNPRNDRRIRRERAINDHTLKTVREESVEPGKSRRMKVEAGEFRKEVAMRNRIKGFTKIEDNSISLTFLVQCGEEVM